MIAALDLVCRGLLFVVFVVAAVAKLRDRDGTRTAVAAFGAPASLAGPIAIVLPAAELITAALLVSPASALAGAIAGTALLGVFTIAIAVNLARGRRPACRCFGQLSAEPVGRGTLVRNGILLVVATALVAAEVARPSPDPIARLAHAGPEVVAVTAVVLATAAIAAAVAVALAVLRAYGRVLRRLAELERRLAELGYDDGDYEYEARAPEIGLQPGTGAPLSGAVMTDGGALVLAEVAPPPKRLLILFTSPQCEPCSTLLPKIADWQRTHGERLSFAVAIDGTAEEARAEAREYALAHAIVDGGAALADAFEAHGTPSAVLVDHDGAVASWVATGSEAIERLVHVAARPAPIAIGESVPELEVEMLDGDRFSLADLRGRTAAILFWNPDCGFCREMHGQLRDYETMVDGKGPALVIASSGTREATTAEGFSSKVVLDHDQLLADTFGAHGTPMAVLLAPEGTVASDVAAGAPAVVDLLTPPALSIAQVPGRRDSPLSGRVG